MDTILSIVSNFGIKLRLRFRITTVAHVFSGTRCALCRKSVAARMTRVKERGRNPKKMTLQMCEQRRLGSPPSTAQVRSLLDKYGLRVTRTRLGLTKLLFSKGDRHITADALAAEAFEARIFASLATVYNVLHLLVGVGLVRTFTVHGGKAIFDTNVSDHCHFYYEDTGEIVDIPPNALPLIDTFTPPNGYEVVRADVVIRLKPREKQDAMQQLLIHSEWLED